MNTTGARRVRAWGGWMVAAGCLLAAMALVLPGCVGTPAMQDVAGQNAANAEAYAANVGTLAAAAREMAGRQSEAMRRMARERVSADLIRLRAAVPLSAPSDAELVDGASAWMRSLRGEVEALAGRVNSAPPERRVATGAALADDHGATIDLAMSTPGFTPERVLRDASALDAINERIDGEPSVEVRRSLLERREAILDPYLPAQLASTSAARFTGAIDQLAQTIERQGAMLGMHAAAIRARAAGTGRVLDGARDPTLRSAAIELIGQIWGSSAADELRERLRRLDEAIGAVGTIGASAPASARR